MRMKSVMSSDSLSVRVQEERRRRVQNGERSTPEMSMTLDRNFGKESQQKASAPPSSSASAPPSVLSQSFFQQKMKNSLDAVLEEMARRVALAGDGREISNSLDDSVAVDSSGSSQVEVASCRNSIATESFFAFSQVGDADNGSATSGVDSFQQQEVCCA